MRLLSLRGGQLGHDEFFNKKDRPPYAVISHRWGADGDEVTFKDMINGTGDLKEGYRKIQFCKTRATADGLEYFWIDTCCIDKTNSTELAEAINSMFRWYRGASKCYVYMSDVSTGNYAQDKECPQSVWEPAFRKSNWFTRGWTLQELIAPPHVEFFSVEGNLLGDKTSLEGLLHELTKIPVEALRGSPLSEFSVEERMSWAARRQTKREEDKAYSLLGIFGIYLLPIYGEGQERALRRVRREIEDDKTQKPRADSVEIHNAAKNGDLRLLRKYLRPGTSVNIHDIDDHDRTALHHAKTARIVELLIDAGALVNQEDAYGQTPLHRAIQERRIEAVKALLSRRAKTSQADDAGKTPTDLAEDCPAAGWLLKHGWDKDGLFHMAWLGDVEGVAFFLAQGSEVDKQQPLGETALIEASRHGDTEVVKLLLEAGADKEARMKNGNWTSLLVAVTNNRKETVKTLILAGAKLDTTEDRNHDALSEAAHKGHWEIARMLIENGARVSSGDFRGNTPLHCSCHRADPSFTQFLVDKGAPVNAQNEFGGTPLLETIGHHPKEAKNHARILLENGADATIGNHAGYTPMSEAARLGNEEVLKLLLKQVPQPSLPSNVSRPGAFSWTPLAEACFHIHSGCVKLLLDAGVNTEVRNDEWCTPLHHAARRSHSSVDIVKMLVDRGAFLEARDKNNATPLALAAQYSNAEVVQALLDAGADANCRSYAGDPQVNGYTPLHLAVSTNNRQAVEVLVRVGVDLEVQTADTKCTALMCAAKGKEWDLVDVLVKSGANVDTRDVLRTTPLMEAAKAGELETIKLLINNGANRQLRDTIGRTAWIWAKHEGWGSELEALLQHT